jgi:MinD-like ATPase involved in chromosome partitioning or flagellar assembly
MRIIPVASGKGGVGKTTFCLNLALTLSKYRQTVLIDLDPGTSSLRSFLDMPVKKDIFHFLKKDIPIDECITPLNTNLDPEGLFKKFYLIASPKNFVHDIVNFSDQIKTKLIRGINSIKADYVIIDNKAGLDTNVMDFLPVTNTGILIFTPKVKAATITAAEMVRAAIFRICRTLLAQQEQFSFNLYQSKDKSENSRVITSIKEKIDEICGYDEGSFEDFLIELGKKFKKNIIIKTIRQFIENYRVYFVLNQFDSVQESADRVIKPFVERIYSSISSKISVNNLGWLEEHKKLNSWYSELKSSVGINEKKHKKDIDIKEITDNEIGRQLNLLNKMYTHGCGKDPLTNLDFIVEGIKGIGLSSTQDLGMRKILSNQEILRGLT